MDIYLLKSIYKVYYNEVTYFHSWVSINSNKYVSKVELISSYQQTNALILFYEVHFKIQRQLQI